MKDICVNPGSRELRRDGTYDAVRLLFLMGLMKTGTPDTSRTQL